MNYMAVNKVKLSIGGTEYSILAEDDVKYVQELGKELDIAFSKIMKANMSLSTTQAAVLLALDYAILSSYYTISLAKGIEYEPQVYSIYHSHSMSPAVSRRLQ